MGRLMSRPNPLEISGRRVDRAFVGRLMTEPFPLEALGSVWRARGVGPGPKVPTMPHFPTGEVDHPRLGKRVKLIVLSWGIVYY